MSNKNATIKRPNMHQKIELKEEEEEGMMLIHAYRQGGFMSNKKLGSSPIREKEKEGRNK